MLKRVFLQRVTHLGTQTEYTLAKYSEYPESDPLDTNATHEYIAAWTCRAGSERE